MKTNIYKVKGNNGQTYDDYGDDTVVVEAITEALATVKGMNLLEAVGCCHDITAELIFENVIMKKPKPAGPTCIHCHKNPNKL